MTETTQDPTITITETKTRGVSLVSVGGHVMGRISTHGHGHTYRAARRNGTDDDIRRISQGFRTKEAAAAWIARSA